VFSIEANLIKLLSDISEESFIPFAELGSGKQYDSFIYLVIFQEYQVLAEEVTA
jgi:hypothetical protein